MIPFADGVPSGCPVGACPASANQLATEARGGVMGNPYVDGNLGGGLLKSMTMVLDYARKRIAFVDAASDD